jgi:hypothetical protein
MKAFLGGIGSAIGAGAILAAVPMFVAMSLGAIGGLGALGIMGWRLYRRWQRSDDE